MFTWCIMRGQPCIVRARRDLHIGRQLKAALCQVVPGEDIRRCDVVCAPIDCDSLANSDVSWSERAARGPRELVPLQQYALWAWTSFKLIQSNVLAVDCNSLTDTEP